MKGREKVTNFDKVTESPEKLSEFISDITTDCWGCRVVNMSACPHASDGKTCFCSQKQVERWLKMEAK